MLPCFGGSYLKKGRAREAREHSRKPCGYDGSDVARWGGGTGAGLGWGWDGGGRAGFFLGGRAWWRGGTWRYVGMTEIWTDSMQTVRSKERARG